jgi:CRP-like cAMP-binding protein
MSDRALVALRRRGNDFFTAEDWEQALACYAELVRLDPGDHRSRFRASRCLLNLGERERAVTAYHAAAEGLLGKGYLLSAMAACKEALRVNPGEKRVKDTLRRIHGRAATAATGRSPVPPPLPPDPLVDDADLWTALMGLSGSELVDKAMSVLALPPSDAPPEEDSRPPLPLFADLEREAFVEAVERMELLELPEGEVLIEEGTPGDAVYVICAGGAKIVRGVGTDEVVELARIGGGTLVGEMALLTDAPRSASVVTDRPSEVFKMQRSVLQELAKQHPAVPKQLVEFCRNRLLANLVATSPLFNPFHDADRQLLLGKFVSRVYAPGKPILEEGKEGEGLFVILTGEVQVTRKDAQGETVVLANLREGDVLGEIGMIKDTPATATVTAVRKTAVVMLPADDFAEIVSEPRNEKAREYLLGLSEERLKRAQTALEAAAEEIADDDLIVV